MYLAKDVHYGYCNQLRGHDPLPNLSQKLHHLVKSNLPDHSMSYMNLECKYFNAITNISAKLSLERNKDLHNEMIKHELSNIGMHQGLYLPTNPRKLVVSVVMNSGTPMQSAAKCPFLLVFETADWAGPDSIDDKIIIQSDTSDNSQESCRRGIKKQTSILSKKEVTGVLQPVRVPHYNNFAELKMEEEITLDSANGNLQQLNSSEQNLEEEEKDGYEEGSDDPSKEFANLRRSRGRGLYQTLLVNNFDGTRYELSPTRDEENFCNDERHISSKKSKIPSVRKEFLKSATILSQGRGLRKGTEKWYDYWDRPLCTSPPLGIVSRKDTEKTACIFKVYDDCRQDALTIQFIKVLYDSYALEHHMSLYLYPYRVVPNRTGKGKSMGGIIQVRFHI